MIYIGIDVAKDKHDCSITNQDVKVDSCTIATMMMSDMNLKSYSDTSYHNEELKSLTRYRFDKVKERAKLKSSRPPCKYPFPRTRKDCAYTSYGFCIRFII